MIYKYFVKVLYIYFKIFCLFILKIFIFIIYIQIHCAIHFFSLLYCLHFSLFPFIYPQLIWKLYGLVF